MIVRLFKEGPVYTMYMPHVILVLLHRNQLGFFYSAREVVVCLFGFFVVFVLVVFFSVGTGPVWENVVE